MKLEKKDIIEMNNQGKNWFLENTNKNKQLSEVIGMHNKKRPQITNILNKTRV